MTTADCEPAWLRGSASGGAIPLHNSLLLKVVDSRHTGYSQKSGQDQIPPQR
jgi:hypothetical protein